MRRKTKTLKLIKNKSDEIYEKYRRHRKPMPPPTKIIEDKRRKSRKKQKEELQMEVK